MVVASHFTPVVRERYRIGVPRSGFYREILNTDSEIFGGGNVGNWGGVEAQPLEWHGHPFSIEVTLPPLGTVMFKPEAKALPPQVEIQQAASTGE